MSDGGDAIELWLGLSATAWSGVAAIATAAAVLVALAGALLVLRQLRQARDLAEEQARPYLVAFLRESEADWSISDFVVRNIGQTAARQITMTFDPPYLRSDEPADHTFMATRFVAGTTSVLPPGGELRTFLDLSTDMQRVRGSDPDSPTSRPFTVTLFYADRRGVQITESFDLDPWEGVGALRADVHGIHHIAKTLRAWTKSQGLNQY